MMLAAKNFQRLSESARMFFAISPDKKPAKVGPIMIGGKKPSPDKTVAPIKSEIKPTAAPAAGPKQKPESIMGKNSKLTLSEGVI